LWNSLDTPRGGLIVASLRQPRFYSGGQGTRGSKATCSCRPTTVSDHSARRVLCLPLDA
jgi:hypothetical protein